MDSYVFIEKASTKQMKHWKKSGQADEYLVINSTVKPLLTGTYQTVQRTASGESADIGIIELLHCTGISINAHRLSFVLSTVEDAVPPRRLY